MRVPSMLAGPMTASHLNVHLPLVKPYLNCRVFDAMEPMSKGIHRALIPVESKLEHSVGVELQEASPGYHLFTQTDMVEFLCTHSKELGFTATTSVMELGAVQSTVYAAPSHMKVMDVVKCMRNTSLHAVAIVEPMGDYDTELALVMVSVFSQPPEFRNGNLGFTPASRPSHEKTFISFYADSISWFFELFT